MNRRKVRWMVQCTPSLKHAGEPTCWAAAGAKYVRHPVQVAVPRICTWTSPGLHLIQCIGAAAEGASALVIQNRFGVCRELLAWHDQFVVVTSLWQCPFAISFPCDNAATSTSRHDTN